MQILLVGGLTRDYVPFLTALGESPGKVAGHLSSTAMALEEAEAGRVEVMVVSDCLEEPGPIAFIEQILRINPMIHYALMSNEAPETFHERTEGLGVLMQLSPSPTAEEAEILLQQLAKIEALSRAGGL